MELSSGDRDNEEDIDDKNNSVDYDVVDGNTWTIVAIERKPDLLRNYIQEVD